MRRNRRGRKKAKKNKLVVPFMIFAILLLSAACGYVTYNYNYIKYWNGLIYPGVTVGGVNLSEKTKDEAKEILKHDFSEQIVKKNININVEGKVYTLNYSKISPKYSIDDAVNTAFNYGKSSNIFAQFIMLKMNKDENFDLKFSYDEKPVKELVSNIQSEVNKDPVNASLGIDNGNLNVIPEVNGKKLEKEKLEKETLSKISGSIGQNVNVNALVKQIPANIKGDSLKSINSLIGTYSTNFASSSSQRANNIALATKSINGKILMPGEVFSFNDTVGERTGERGYEPAPVIIGNKLESGLGGGICQVSTTLYNAVSRAGMTSIEREHHTMPVHYVPQGMDATVDYGNIDYKFKNIYQYPVYIQAYISNGNIIFNLYSNSSMKN
ncbi:vancomycin resistance protein W [Clostridium carboxidivorans P7]|uniref:VanW family protein n=1 Tax=Clostridium carboxidivorans P7 TaxID=536227 RepID=C6Q1F4_9CLOT|nr:VanW family protein [Clostridium carboxidivorans]AKN33365.1 vancomycin resistance protein W [Clostridium carboxidivorans P7]EET84678.1 VanW family protein [Clostridium carboxidivorans P7]